MAPEEAFNYHSGLWLLLSHIILSQTCCKNSEMIALKIVKWKIACKKENKDFADLVKDVKSVVGFKTRSGCKTVSKWWPPKSIFQDEG